MISAPSILPYDTIILSLVNATAVVIEGPPKVTTYPSDGYAPVESKIYIDKDFIGG